MTVLDNIWRAGAALALAVLAAGSPRAAWAQEDMRVLDWTLHPIAMPPDTMQEGCAISTDGMTAYVLARDHDGTQRVYAAPASTCSAKAVMTADCAKHFSCSLLMSAPNTLVFYSSSQLWSCAVTDPKGPKPIALEVDPKQNFPKGDFDGIVTTPASSIIVVSSQFYIWVVDASRRFVLSRTLRRDIEAHRPQTRKGTAPDYEPLGRLGAISPDGHSLICAAGMSAAVLSLGGGAVVWRRSVPCKRVSYVAFSGDGRYLLIDGKVFAAGNLDVPLFEPGVECSCANFDRADDMILVNGLNGVATYGPQGQLLKQYGMSDVTMISATPVGGSAWILMRNILMLAKFPVAP